MTLPIDRTTKAALDANLVNGVTSDAPVLKANNDNLYNTNDELYNYVQALISAGVLSPYPPAQYNKLINGNFDIWQRGTSWTNPASGNYTADRFSTVISITGTLPTSIIHSKQILNPGDIQGAYFFYRLNSNGAGAGFGANDGYVVGQKIENGVRHLCGTDKQVTLSFCARSSITGKKIGVYATQNYGTGGSPTTAENIKGSNFTLTSTWTKYTVTFKTNTLAGRTFGANNDDHLFVQFVYEWGAGAYATVVNAAGVAETFGGSGNIDIAQVQVNAGDQALPFQPRSLEDELALCQRYYEKSYNYAVGSGTALQPAGAQTFVLPSNTIASGQSYGTVRYAVKKRTTPTVAIFPYTTPTNIGRVSDNGGTDLGASSGSVAQNGDGSFTVYNGSGGTLTTLTNAIFFHWGSDSEL